MKRLLLHIPIGLVMGLYPLPDTALSNLFIFYERNEDRWIKDQAWLDTKGALWGFCIGRVILFIVGGLFLYKLLEALL